MNMQKNMPLPIISVLRSIPQAKAVISGNEEYPDISGTVKFYQTRLGVIVNAELKGLPKSDSACNSRVFAFHIHEGGLCSGDKDDPFSNVMSHYNPRNCNHPYHAGDLPPLFGNNGHSLMIFLTDRFTVSEIIGRAVIIHDRPDDFSTQPSGNAGTKIACGEIRKISR